MPELECWHFSGVVCRKTYEPDENACVLWPRKIWWFQDVSHQFVMNKARGEAWRLGHYVPVFPVQYRKSNTVPKWRDSSSFQCQKRGKSWPQGKIYTSGISCQAHPSHFTAIRKLSVFLWQVMCYSIPDLGAQSPLLLYTRHWTPCKNDFLGVNLSI